MSSMEQWFRRMVGKTTMIPTRVELYAGEYLEAHGQRFMTNFGVMNAVQIAADHYRYSLILQERIGKLGELRRRAGK